MLGFIWITMIVLSFGFSFFTGNIAGTSEALFESCFECVEFMLKTGAFMIMWSGFMNVAEKSGLSRKISRLLSPFIAVVFKNVSRGSKAERQISANISANMLGLSNASTPLGIEAMKTLGRESKNGIATDDMCMLAVINCASVQIFPSTLIAVRTAMGSSCPGDIVFPIWITSAITLFGGIVVAKFFERRNYCG